MKSVLTKQQELTKVFTGFRVDGGVGTLKVHLRYDDRCGNGHNTFSITGELYRGRVCMGMGCLHDDIAVYAPELEHLIKWHLMTSVEPIHYVSNTLYHASTKDCNGSLKGEFRAFTYNVLVGAEVLFKSKVFYSFRNWLHRDEAKAEVTRFIEYIKPELNPTIEQVGSGTPSEGKEPDLEAARNSAIWPDATLKQLQDKSALEARLPALRLEFKEMVESLGFTY